MAPVMLLAGGYEGKLNTLAFDPEAATLEIVASNTEAGEAPTWIAFSNDSKHFYTIDEHSDQNGFVASFDLDLQTGIATRTSSVPSGGHAPASTVILYPAEEHKSSQDHPPRLVTAHYFGENVSSIPIDPVSGKLEADLGARQLISFKGHGTPGPVKSRQQQHHPHEANLDPTGRFIVVPDLGTDEIHVLRINAAGDLVADHKQGVTTLSAGAGPRHVLFNPLGDKTILYIMNELSNSISVYNFIYPAEGSKNLFPVLEPLQPDLSILPAQPFPHQSDFTNWHSAELGLSPDKSALFASNRAEPHDPVGADPQAMGEEDLLAVFELDASTGLVKSPTERPKLIASGGRAPRHFSFSHLGKQAKTGLPAGREYVAVALHDSDEVVISEWLGGAELKEVVRKKGVGKPGIVVFV